MGTLEIPLFPLRTVLFPGMPLPLRVFEERYKVMTRHLIERGGEFGVLLIKQGQEVGGGAVPHAVGTTAVIEDYEEVEGGRFVLSCRGRRRFRLVRMLPPRPYPFGEISFIRDRPVAPGEALDDTMAEIRETFPRYFRLALALTDQWARPFELPQDPHQLVNFLAPWIKAEEQVKQELLEIEDPTARLTFLARLLETLHREALAEVAEKRRQRFAGLGAQN